MCPPRLNLLDEYLKTFIENEDLAWERFEKVVTNKDVAACYDMSLKDFEHSGIYDLFKVCELFFFSLIYISRPVNNVYMCILSNKILIYVGNV